MKSVKKINYNKLNNMLYKKLSQFNYIKNLKYLKLNNNINHITYNETTNCFKILNNSSCYFKLNYKELIKIKKVLKSGYLMLSTSLGILTDKKAILHKIGGVVICYIN